MLALSAFAAVLVFSHLRSPDSVTYFDGWGTARMEMPALWHVLLLGTLGIFTVVLCERLGAVDCIPKARLSDLWAPLPIPLSEYPPIDYWQAEENQPRLRAAWKRLWCETALSMLTWMLLFDAAIIEAARKNPPQLDDRFGIVTAVFVLVWMILLMRGHLIYYVSKADLEKWNNERKNK